MNQTQFSNLVQKLEVFAKRQPVTYKFQVRLLALLGYGYIFLVLGLIITLSMFGIPKLLGMLASVRNGRLMLLIVLFGVGTPLVLIYSIFNALWFRIPPPEGLELHPSQAPRLFQLLHDLKRELRAAPVHRVLLTNEFNAAVAQIPRFGFFGGYRNYLMIGLPLLQSLAPGQFHAVLAHELGHLSGKHGHFGHWIYRIRRSWYQLLSGLENTAPDQADGAIAGMLALASLLGRGIFVFFFQWYAPFFSAYSFVLARADEYEADRYAANIVGPNNLAGALTNIAIKGGHVLPAFWQTILLRSKVASEPPEPYTELAIQMQQQPLAGEVEGWLKSALAYQTNLDDTHPCLKERLQQVGFTPDKAFSLLKPIRVTAANHFLEQALPPIIAYFNQEWQEGIGPEWRSQHRKTLQLQQQLESLEGANASDTMSLENRWQRASLTAELRGLEIAVPDLQQVLSEQPHHPGANALFGQYLLHNGDHTGIQHLERAMAEDADVFEWGAPLIFAFIKEHEGEGAATQYWHEARQKAEILQKARLERSHVTHHHNFVLPELAPGVRQAIASKLSAYSEIKAAYMVQKVVQYLPESPLYILAVEPQDLSLSSRGEGSCDKKITGTIMQELDLPEKTILILLDGEQTALKVKLRKMNGAALL